MTSVFGVPILLNAVIELIDPFWYEQREKKNCGMESVDSFDVHRMRQPQNTFCEYEKKKMGRNSKKNELTNQCWWSLCMRFIPIAGHKQLCVVMSLNRRFHMVNGLSADAA